MQELMSVMRQPSSLERRRGGENQAVRGDTSSKDKMEQKVSCNGLDPPSCLHLVAGHGRVF